MNATGRRTQSHCPTRLARPAGARARPSPGAWDRGAPQLATVGADEFERARESILIEARDINVGQGVARTSLRAPRGF